MRNIFFNLRNFLRWFCALGILVVLCLWFFNHIDREILWESLLQARPELLLGAFLCFTTIIFLNALQLKMFLPDYEMIPFAWMFCLASIFLLTFNVVPLWGGHAIFVFLLGRQKNMGKIAGLSVLTLDQLMEGIGKIFLFGVVAFSIPFPGRMQVGVRSFYVIMAVAITATFLLAYFFRDKPRHFNNGNPSLWERLFSKFANWAHLLNPLRCWKRLVATAILAVFMKLFLVLGIFFVQKSFGEQIGVKETFLVGAAISLATMFPLTPGLLGQFESGGVLAYEYVGIQASVGLALSFMIHVLHTLPLLIFGYFSFLKIGSGKFKAFGLKSQVSSMEVSAFPSESSSS